MNEVKSIRNPVMMLITKEQYKKLAEASYQNMVPIIKLFMGNITWLVTCIEHGILYGYADIGQQSVEWGSLVHEDELPTLRHPMGFYMERDYYFQHKDGAKYLEMESLVGI